MKNLKKISLILFIPLLFSLNSCRKCGPRKTSFSPPNWIQGRWLQERNGTIIGNSGWEFTKSDIIQVSSSTHETSLEKNNKAACEARQKVKVTEDKSNDNYNADIEYDQTTLKYHFRKVSDDIIEWDGPFSKVTFKKQ